MKIAVYHDLPSGGAKRTLYESMKRLAERHRLDVYTLSTADRDFCSLSDFATAEYTYQFSPSKLFQSPFGRINQALRWMDLQRLDRLSRRIAREIDSRKYDVVFAQPCMWTQAPLVLRHLGTPSIYYCHEPPRHLYEPLFGGVYRLHVLTSIQRQNNWEEGSRHLYRALHIDPTLAVDLDLFYDLALGGQPVGHRGVSKLKGFDENSSRLQRLVRESVDSLSDGHVRNQTLGTAYCALGLVAYDLGPRSQFRKYFGRALKYRPELILNSSLVEKYFKSYVDKERVEKLKKFVGRSS